MKFIEISEAQRLSFENTEEGLAHIKDLHDKASKQRPILVDVINPNHGALLVGVGCMDGMVLEYQSEDHTAPLLRSQHNDLKDTARVVVFYYYNSYTEVPLKNLVTIEDAFYCIKKFLETGEICTHIKWVES